MSDESKNSNTQTGQDGATGAATAAEEDTISLLDLIAVLARHKWLITGVTGLAAIGVLAYSIISLVLPPEQSPLPNYYRPETTVLITEDSGSSAQQLLTQSGLGGFAALAGVQGGGRTNGQLALEILKGRWLVDRIVSEFDIADRYEIEEKVRTNSRRVVRENTVAELDEETGILTIGFEAIDPVFAHEVANRVTELLQARFSDIGIDRSRTRAELLEEKRIEVEERIRELEEAIKAFQREHGTFNVEAAVTEAAEMRGRVRSDLILKNVEISTYSELARVNDPELQRLRAERESLRELLQQMEEGSTGIEALPSQDELPDLAIEFQRLQRDLAVQAEIYKTLTQQYELARLDSEGQTQTFQVLERAEIPEVKAGPSRARISIITTITAFFLSVFAAFVVEYFQRVKQDPEEGPKLAQITSDLRLTRKKSE